MPGETNHSPYAHELPAERFEPAGLFWLEPAVIQDVDHLINATHLPTMSLGAETHADEMADARKELAAILIPPKDPLRGELGRALDIGFMYGSLIAHGSLEYGADAAQRSDPPAHSDDRPMPETLSRSISAAAKGIDPDSFDGSHQLFMRLRDVEVAYAHSDLLAFSLAATQDHMRAEFAEYHKPERDLTPGETRRLQSLYYAGALVGALMHSDERNLGKPHVEIVRAMQAPSESVALRMEFESDDDVVKAIDGALSSKLSFSYVETPEEPSYVAVVANGFQYGPNTMSIPLFIPGMEEPRLMKKVPLSDVQALITRDIDPQTGEYEGFGLIADPLLYATMPQEARIVGLALKDGSCVAAYDPAHPNASVVRGLAAANSGTKPEDTTYSYGIETAPPPHQGFFARNSGRIALGAGLAGPWAFDAITELADAGPTHPDQDVIVNVLTVAGYAGIRLWQRSLGRHDQRNDATYQLLLDQMTGHR